jgi:hypothetical protein
MTQCQLTFLITNDSHPTSFRCLTDESQLSTRSERRDINGDYGDYRDRTSPRREREEREYANNESRGNTQSTPRSMVDRGVFSDIFNPLTFVDEAVRSFAATQGPVDLGPDFAPGVGSVVCGRGECPPFSSAFDFDGSRESRRTSGLRNPR